MAKKKLPNPFYVLVVLVGIAFTVTACAYGMSTFIYMQIDNPRVPHPDSDGWVQMVDENGLSFMLTELVVLAIATIGVLGWDSYFEDLQPQSDSSDELEEKQEDSSHTTGPSETSDSTESETTV